MKPRANGFTLIELVVSLFVISVIIAISIPSLKGAAARAESTACESNQRLLRGALQEYSLETGHLPAESDSDGMIADLRRNDYLETLPKCPSGGHYVITVNPDGSFTVSCSVHGTLGSD